MGVATDDTAHLDGFRVLPVTELDRLRVYVKLFAGGEPCPDVFPDFLLFDAPVGGRADAAQEAALILGQAMCTFMNAGAGRDALFLLADKFVAAVPDILPRYKLESVLPPSGGPMFIWRKPDGTYLKVQEGDEGFVEALSETERLELLRAQVQDDESGTDAFP